MDAPSSESLIQRCRVQLVLVAQRRRQPSTATAFCRPADRRRAVERASATSLCYSQRSAATRLSRERGVAAQRPSPSRPPPAASVCRPAADGGNRSSVGAGVVFDVTSSLPPSRHPTVLQHPASRNARIGDHQRRRWCWSLDDSETVSDAVVVGRTPRQWTAAADGSDAVLWARRRHLDGRWQLSNRVDVRRGSRFGTKDVIRY
jgi:hypothetical protein